ncbi:MAG: transcriptional regulator, partial [Gammaproteobacteria bacterium CG22_combo_CG10-13_8_21_14_all_40_8]
MFNPPTITKLKDRTLDKFDRMQQLHRIFTSRTSPITIKELASKLECSEKTIKRGIDSLRDYVQAPLVYCSLQRGWSYNKQVASQFELPGLWLTSNEILGLAMILQLVQGMDTGLASADMAMIKSVVVTLLKSRKVPFALFEQKVRYLPKNKYSAK